MKTFLNALYNYLTILVAIALFFFIILGFPYILADKTGLDGEGRIAWLFMLVFSIFGTFIFSFFYLIFLYLFSYFLKKILYNKKLLFGFVLISFPLSFFLSFWLEEKWGESIYSWSHFSFGFEFPVFVLPALINIFLIVINFYFYVSLYKKYSPPLPSRKWRGHP